MKTATMGICDMCGEDTTGLTLVPLRMGAEAVVVVCEDCRWEPSLASV